MRRRSSYDARCAPDCHLLRYEWLVSVTGFYAPHDFDAPWIAKLDAFWDLDHWLPLMPLEWAVRPARAELAISWSRTRAC